MGPGGHLLVPELLINVRGVLDYPWRPPSSNVDSNVVKWLFLPDHMTPPNPLFLLCKPILTF